MKGNTISSNTLNESGKIWLDKTLQVLKVQEYGKGTVRNDMQELTLLFKFYNAISVEDLRQEHIEKYLVFIKENHQIGRAKCRSVAQTCSFFFKKIMPVNYIVPSNLYPKKQFVLPDIMTEMQVEQLFRSHLILKERCVIGLLYGCGMRISEVTNLKITDIDSENQRIKVVQSLPRQKRGKRWKRPFHAASTLTFGTVASLLFRIRTTERICVYQHANKAFHAYSQYASGGEFGDEKGRF